MQTKKLRPGSEPRPAVLVLGAYGGVGRELVAGLLRDTDLRVVVAGRDESRLADLLEAHGSERLALRVIDARDRAGLAEVFAGSDLAINAIGPYLRHGVGIARAAIDGATPLIDLATEQEHYRRLRKLDGPARERGIFLLTAAGLWPGLASLLAADLARRTPGVERLEMHIAAGRPPDANSGAANLLSAMLEAQHRQEVFRGGKLVPLTLGKPIVDMTLPEPYGARKMMPWPVIDTLTLPGKLGLRDFESFVAVGKTKAPSRLGLVIFTGLMRLLRPGSWDWSYRLARRRADEAVKTRHELGVERGIGLECVVTLVARSPTSEIRSSLRVPEGAAGSAYLPILAARSWARGEVHSTGVVTPEDLFDGRTLCDQISQLGWPLDLFEGDEAGTSSNQGESHA